MRTARTVDELIAVEWDPEDLFSPLDAPSAADPAALPDIEEQNALIEAIASANAAHERALQDELDRRVAEAYALGFEEGRQEGEAAEGARLRGAVQAAEDALDALRAGEMRWTGTIEENVCALAIAVARQVIGRELSGDAEAVMAIVRRAVAEFPIDQPLRIRVSPQDLALISAGDADAALSASVAPGREIRWIAEPAIAQGGCLVEGRERIVDGRVDNALERLYRRLTYTHA